MPKSIWIVLVLIFAHILGSSTNSLSMQQPLYPVLSSPKSGPTYKIIQKELRLSTQAAELITYVSNLLATTNGPIAYLNTKSDYVVVAAAVRYYTLSEGRLEENLLGLLTENLIRVEVFLYCLPEKSRKAAGCLLLPVALKHKRSEIIAFFINAGFPVTVCNWEGNNFIHQVLLSDDNYLPDTVLKVHAIVFFLAESGVDLNCANLNGQTVLDVLDGLLSKNKLYEMTRSYLVKKGARYGESLNKSKVLEIYNLLKARSFNAASSLIAAGGLCLDDPYDSGNDSTLLMFSVGCGFKGIVELLVKHGACPSRRNKQNISALDMACKKDREEIRKILVGPLTDIEKTFLADAVNVVVTPGEKQSDRATPAGISVTNQSQVQSAGDSCLLM